MNDRNFRQMLEAQWSRGNFVCVGLDSEPDKIPKSARRRDTASTIFYFNADIVDATKNAVCAYKPNIAFYEAHNGSYLKALHETIVHVHNVASDVPVILDADIGNTNNGYVQMAFDHLGADAITVHPYLGQEALQPFLDRADKGIIVLCRTSNPGAGELQDLNVAVLDQNEISFFSNYDLEPDKEFDFVPLYQHIAYRVARKWNKNGNCGLVVGATYPNKLRQVRGLVGDMPILIQDIDARGGEVEKTVSAGKDSRGTGIIINFLRGIIFASKGADFAEAARRETEKLRDLINQCR